MESSIISAKNLSALCTICILAGVSAQTVTVNSPQGGETFCIGDTVAVTYEVDDAYIEVSNGVKVQVSVDDGDKWISMCHAVTNECTFPHTDPDAGTVDFIMPDTLVFNVGFGQVKKVSTVSDQALIRVVDYVRDDLSGYVPDYVKVKEAASCSGMAINNPVRNSSDPNTQEPSKNEPEGKSRCGSGLGLAFMPAIIWHISRKSKNTHKK
ncbi:MAG: hypothetical protein GF398_01795 [Chitinivibrionales bacterium]|nr:hypothetical protein [Chitinivibrionales bacterium]